MDLDILDQGTSGTKEVSKVKDLGNLNKLLIRGLPDWVDADGVLRTYDLAKHIGVSYQAAYKWFNRDRIPAKRIFEVMRLSAETEARPEGFRPLSVEDFKDFLA